MLDLVPFNWGFIQIGYNGADMCEAYVLNLMVGCYVSEGETQTTEMNKVQRLSEFLPSLLLEVVQLTCNGRKTSDNAALSNLKCELKFDFSINCSLKETCNKC